MIKQPMHLHFDGMDLAGKTTASNNTVARLGGNWEIRRNALTSENPIYLLADSLRRQDAYDAEILGHLYTVAMRADIFSFKFPEGCNTIQDSTIILRSLAYHTVKGNINVTAVLEDILPKHPKFDLSVVLTADIESRLRRLQSRINNQPDEVSSEDYMVVNNPHKFLAMEACLIDLATRHFHSIIIDTTTLTPDAVVGRIVEAMET